jgi:aminoglycoside phosphotransferase family enzyme/predicted kinase
MSDESASVLFWSLATQTAAYPISASRIEMLETHISWVFLAGEFAYKVKKPVNLGFVDFTTLERRRFFCEEELRLNRRLAPQLYLDVVPITGSAESPRIGGSGEALEYCVQMLRFDQKDLLSRLVATKELQPRHIDALARKVAEFHAEIPVAKVAARFGTPDAVAAPIRANFTHLEGPENAAVKDQVERLRAWCEQELSDREFDLLARKHGGRIRECHGDMHLGNIVLLGGTVTIFDCIEFNADLRWIDVASEIAFCAMDLEDRGRVDLARRFLNGYLEWSGDYASTIVLRLYVVYRALVRAKVAQLRRSQGGIDRQEHERLSREMANYLQLADRSTRKKTPFLAITHGLSGSGKTWGSQVVVERLGAIRLRSDIERKRLVGLSPLAESGSGGVGDGLYTTAFNRRTFGKLADLASGLLRLGYPVVVDATFLKRSDRDEFRGLAERFQVPFLILDFPAEAATCRERIRLRSRSRSDASEATEAVLDHQLGMRVPLDEGERAHVISFPSDRYEEIEESVAAIKARRAQFSSEAAE